MDVRPDPKPKRRRRKRTRIVDPTASKRVLLASPECAGGCGRPAENCHHILGRGQGGDDIDVQLVPLCGSGSRGCHGALHGNPYVLEDGRRFDSAVVRAAIGRWIAARPETVAYVLGRLGDGPGRDFLARRYDLAL